MNNLLASLLLLCVVVSGLSEKDLFLAEEEIITEPSSEYYTTSNKSVTNIDSTSLINEDTTQESIKDQDSKNHAASQNVTFVKTAVLNGRQTGNISVLDEGFESEPAKETNVAEYEEDLPQDHLNDEIEDYNKSLRPNIPNSSFIRTDEEEHTNIDYEEKATGHQNIVLNIKSRRGDYDEDRDVSHEFFNVQKLIVKPKNVHVERELQNEDFEGKLSLLNNETEEINNKQHPYDHKRLTGGVQGLQTIPDINLRQISKTNHPVVFNLKYRSGNFGHEHDIDDQEAVANIKPSMNTWPVSRAITTGEGDKTIDDYNNQLSANAYTYNPPKVNKKENKRKPVNIQHIEQPTAPHLEEIKNIADDQTRRRFSEKTYNTHPVYLPRHVELSSADTWKTGYNLEFKEFPNSGLIEHDLPSHRYEFFPSYLIAKYSPDLLYRANQLRLRADHSPDPIKDLISNLNQKIAKSISYPNIPIEKKNNYFSEIQNTHHVPQLVNDPVYPQSAPDSLQKYENPHILQWPHLNHHIDERPNHQRQTQQDVNIPNKFSGIYPRLRDERRLPYNLNYLSKSNV